MGLEIPLLRFYRDSERDWRWQLKSRSGEIVGAASEGFKRLDDAINNHRLVVTLSAEAKVDIDSGVRSDS
jgi:uncharacterized protein YegP (UPF0339 family)